MQYSIFFIYQLLFFTEAAYGSSLSRKEEIKIINCLKQRQNFAFVHPELQKTQIKKCLHYLDSISRSKSLFKADSYENQTTAINKQGDKMLWYLVAMLKWRQNSSKQMALINKVSSCSWFSKTVRRYWLNFFRKRRGTVFTSVATFNQSWNANQGNITVRPSFMEYSDKNIVAAELVLSRINPSLTGELYGRYKVFVTVRENKSNSASYINYLSSCSSRDGRLVLLDLNQSEVLKWHRNRSGLITLSVKVEPLSQYIEPCKSPANIVHRIEGLVVHFRRSRTERLSDERQSRSQFLNAVQGYRNFHIPKHHHETEANSEVSKPNRFVRVKRSPRRIPSGKLRGITLGIPYRRANFNKCSLAPFQLPRRFLQKTLNITWSSNDIKECIGECTQPVPDHVSITNHAIVLNYHSPKNVCCVPIQYETLTYLSRRHDEIVYRELSNFIASKCGCR